MKPTINQILTLAIAKQSEDKLQDAYQLYQSVLEGQPNLGVVHCHLGNILRELSRLDKATEYYKKEIEINPNFIEAH